MRRLFRLGVLCVTTLGLSACASNTGDRGLGGPRGVFHNPYGYGPIFETPATTEHPPYVICNGRRCALLDDDGNYTQMSDEERRAWRDRVRMAEENARFNESDDFVPSPPKREPKGDTKGQNDTQAGSLILD